MWKIRNDFTKVEQNYSSIRQMNRQSRIRFALEINRFCSRLMFMLMLMLMQRTEQTISFLAYSQRINRLYGQHQTSTDWAIENFWKVNKQKRESSNSDHIERHNEAPHIDGNFIFIVVFVAAKKEKVPFCGYTHARTHTDMNTVNRQFDDSKRRKSFLFSSLL